MKTYIILASFRGESYIAQQIDSVLNQSESEWKLLIRDDGSDDATLSIIEKYIKQDPRVLLLKDQLGRLGTVGSFLQLAKAAYEHGADYVLFADQDDYWEKDKVAKQLSLIKSIEIKKNKSLPIAAYCDLAVVDNNLSPISPSYMQYKALRHPQKAPLGLLIFQNTVTGCGLIINRALLKYLCEIKCDQRKIIMHDWWIALLAASNGLLVFDPYVGVKYRQHGGNQIGANKISISENILLKIRSVNRKRGADFFTKIIDQADMLKFFMVHDRHKMSMLHDLVYIRNLGLFNRLIFIIKFKVRRISFLGTLFLWLRILNY